MTRALRGGSMLSAWMNDPLQTGALLPSEQGRRQVEALCPELPPTAGEAREIEASSRFCEASSGLHSRALAELSWPRGDPMAIGRMTVAAVIPFWYFKRKGWL